MIVQIIAYLYFKSHKCKTNSDKKPTSLVVFKVNSSGSIISLQLVQMYSIMLKNRLFFHHYRLSCIKCGIPQHNVYTIMFYFCILHCPFIFLGQVHFFPMIVLMPFCSYPSYNPILTSSFSFLRLLPYSFFQLLQIFLPFFLHFNLQDCLSHNSQAASCLESHKHV